MATSNRIDFVPAEQRKLTIEDDGRRLAVIAKSRVKTVPTESREDSVAAVPRRLTIHDDKRIDADG